MSAQADARARRFERAARLLRNREDGLIVANKTGRVSGDRFRGEKMGIGFTDKQLRDMRGNVLSHNHPDGWKYPENDPRRAGTGFSIADVRLMVEWGPAEIRAVTPGYLYRLRPSLDAESFYQRSVATASPEQVNRLVERVFVETEIDLQGRVARGETSREEAGVLLNHEAVLRLVQKWGIEYDREVST